MRSAAAKKVLNKPTEASSMTSKWNNYLTMLQRHGNGEVAEQMNAFYTYLKEWCSDNVMSIPDHVLMKIVYSGKVRTIQDLYDAGIVCVKNNEEELLSCILKYQELHVIGLNINYDDDHEVLSSPFITSYLPDSEFIPKQQDAQPVVSRKSLPIWITYWQRFSDGERIKSIAMNPGKGKGAVQISTVVGHLLTSLLHGKSLNLRQFFSELEESDPSFVPTIDEWKQLSSAAEKIDFDFGPKSSLKDLVQAVSDDTTTTSTNKGWYNKAKMFVHLKMCQCIIDITNNE